MFTIYPNPAKDHINILTNASKYEYQIINSIGQVVLSGVSNGSNQVSLSDIENGMYFLKVVSDGQISINKILVQ